MFRFLGCCEVQGEVQTTEVGDWPKALAHWNPWGHSGGLGPRCSPCWSKRFHLHYLFQAPASSQALLLPLLGHWMPPFRHLMIFFLLHFQLMRGVLPGSSTDPQCGAVRPARGHPLQCAVISLPAWLFSGTVGSLQTGVSRLLGYSSLTTLEWVSRHGQ